VADALRGATIEWDPEHNLELELRQRSESFVEADCHDLMDVEVQIRGSVGELSDIRVLVHCNGQELEVEVRSFPQLRKRMGDIARMGPGIERYHVLGERTRTHIERGDELWMYWTTDLIHWANWAKSSHWKYEKVIAIKLDGTWFFLDQADAQGLDRSPDQMSRLLAMKLKVLPEEIAVSTSTEPVIPLMERGVEPISVWKVEFKAPEWDDLVDIAVQLEGRSYPTTIRRRQTLEQLEMSLRSFPKRDEWVSWYRPGGIRIGNGISLYEWNTNDVS
jgi:hypothetical protein